jgi:hypothetical protein
VLGGAAEATALLRGCRHVIPSRGAPGPARSASP